jgi:hypothetical protein
MRPTIVSKVLGFILLGIFLVGVVLSLSSLLRAPQPMFETPEPMIIRTTGKSFQATKVYSWSFIPGKPYTDRDKTFMEPDNFCVVTEQGETCDTELTIFFAGRAIVDFYPIAETSKP